MGSALRMEAARLYSNKQCQGGGNCVCVWIDASVCVRMGSRNPRAIRTGKRVPRRISGGVQGMGRPERRPRSREGAFLKLIRGICSSASVRTMDTRVRVCTDAHALGYIGHPHRCSQVLTSADHALRPRRSAGPLTRPADTATPFESRWIHQEAPLRCMA